MDKTINNFHRVVFSIFEDLIKGATNENDARNAYFASLMYGDAARKLTNELKQQGETDVAA